MQVCVVGEYALGVKGASQPSLAPLRELVNPTLTTSEVVRVDFTLSLKRREEAGDF